MRLPAEKEKVILDRYRAGDPVLDVCRELGISKTLFYRVLRRSGLSAKRQTVTVLDEERRREVVARYLAGQNADTVAEAFNVSRATVYNIVHESGASVKQPNKWLSVDEEQRVVETCLSGGTSAAVGAHFDVSQETVLRILKDRGIRLPKGRPRSCEIDDTVFDILTPESAYWIGFLFSDGCVHQDAYGAPCLAIGLAEKDLAHLEALRVFLKSTHKIRRVEKTKTSFGGPCVYFKVRSHPICEALTRWGIVKKRTRVPVPELVRSRDFWRGCVDGDGAVGTTSMRGHIYTEIHLAGQRPLLGAFQEFMHLQGMRPLNIVTAGMRTGAVWEVHTTGSTAESVVNVLYRNCGMALARKNTRAQAIIRGDIDLFPPYVEPKSRINVAEEEE